MEILCDRINKCLNLNITVESLDKELKSISETEEEYQELLRQSLEITESNYKNLDSIFLEDFKKPKTREDYFMCIDEVEILNNFIPKKSNIRIMNINTDIFMDFENKDRSNIDFIFELSKNYKADIICFQNYIFPIKFDYINLLDHNFVDDTICLVNNIKINDPVGMINSLFPYLVSMPNLISSNSVDPYTSCGLLISSKIKPYFDEYYKLDENTGFMFFIINFEGNSLCIMNVYLEEYTHDFIKKVDNISFLVDIFIIFGYISDKNYLQDLKNSCFVDVLKDCSFSGMTNSRCNYLFFQNVDYKYNVNLHYTKKLDILPVILDF